MVLVYRFLVNLLEPFTFAFLLCAIALISLWSRGSLRTRRLGLFTSLFFLLGLLSTPAISYLAAGSLEWQYPPVRTFPEHAQAIVILGGSVRLVGPNRQQAEPGQDTLYRCLLGAELYRKSGGCPVFVSGGQVVPDPKQPIVAQVMADFLVQLGVPPADIVQEAESRTTFENAVNVAKLLDQRKIQRVVLVTEATHLRRSIMCFDAVGIQTFPRGAYYRARSFDNGPFALVPCAWAARDMNRVAHEWLGIVWYLPKLAGLKKQGHDT